MQDNMARWAQIVYWDRMDLLELHRLEREREKLNASLRAQRKRLVMLTDIYFIESMQPKYQLVPYWIDLEPATAELRMDLFERQIYPIWAALQWKNQDDKRGDIEILHAQDLAIYDSGFKPDRLGSDSKREFKKKVSAQFSEVMK
jgi:hypothetical protein